MPTAWPFMASFTDRNMFPFAKFWMFAELKTAQIILFLVGRFFSTYAINVGFQFTVEVMPTCLRGQGNALVNVMSMVSQMASPYIVYSVKMIMIKKVKKLFSRFSVRYIGEGTFSDYRLPLHARGHTRPLLARNRRPKDA